MSEQYECSDCGQRLNLVIHSPMCPECNGELKKLRWTKGGDGTHWEGCDEVHWDCKISKMEAESKRLRDALSNIRTQFFADGDDGIIVLKMQEIARTALEQK